MILIADASALIALASCDSLAKRAGLVSSVAPLIAQIAASPVFISENLIQTVLELADEATKLE